MRRAVIHADGASFGNPGPAGIGVCIEIDGDLTEISKPIGIATNNVAEYSALIAGLQKAHSMGAQHAVVYLDSELLVRQIKGEYKIKSQSLRPLYEQALALSCKFAKFSITHIPRERNSHADRLSKKGADSNPVVNTHAPDNGDTHSPEQRGLF